MSIYLGNIRFDQVADCLGYSLTEQDKILFDEFHNSKSDLGGMESSFHIFDIPKCIVFKGEKAKAAILKLFTKDKMTKVMGAIPVMEQE
jgi:hypothetical protein